MSGRNDEKLVLCKLQKAFDLIKSKKFEEAEKVLYELIDEYPDFPPGYGHLAEVLWEQGKIEQANFYFKIVTEMIPHSKLGSLGVFHTYWEMEDYQSALDEIKRFKEAGGKCKDYEEIIDELKTKKMIDDNLNWL